MTTFSTDVALEPTYLDLIDIAAGYGVLSAPVDGLLPGDTVQMVSLTVVPTAGGAPIISSSIDMVQRTAGYFEWVTQAEIDAHFTLTSANIAAIAAGSFSYSISVSVLRNGVTLTREVQSGTIAARTASGPTPPLVVNSITMTGGPVTGGIGSTAQLHATAYDGLGNAVPTATIVWSSSNPLVASVDQSGLVSFIMPGSTTIIASCMGVQATTSATANDPAFVAPTDKQVAGWTSADSSWKPRTLDASWIQPGTFGGNGLSVYTFPGVVDAGAFVGDGSGLSNLAAADITGILAPVNGGTGVASPAAGNLLVGAGASAMTALAPGAAGGYVRSSGAAWVRAAIVTADISDLTTAATGITKLGTVSVGVWNASVISTTYTQAQLVSLTAGTGITVGGTATAPTVAIANTYVGQTSITTLGTIATGVWQGSSIATTYTDAKIQTVTGTLNRLTIGGTATAPTFDIAATYVGQTSITTLGTIATGVWNGSVIGTAYTSAQLVSLTGTLNRVTIGGTSTAPTVDISAAYIGQGSITTVGTIGSGVWQGTAIADTYLAGLSVSKLTGTTLPAGIVSSSLTSVGAIASGTWQGTIVSPTYGGTGVNNGASTLTLAANMATSGAFGLTLTVTALTNVTLPTSGTLVNTAVTALSSLATVGTITSGVWNGTAIANAFIASGLDVAKLTAGTTLPANVVTSSLTAVGTVVTGTWTATPIANAYIATGLDVTKLTVGATLPANVTGSSLTSVGTIATGTWQGSVISTSYTAAQIVSVAGTANRVTASTVAGAVTIDISAAYVGQNTITTLGTVATGVWAATAIGATVGGTGLTSYTLGDMLYSSNTNTLAKLAGNTSATRKWLSQTGTGAVSAPPAWNLITTADVSDIATAATGITQVGTIGTGTWQGSVIGPQYGGTGVNNASSTITLGGSLTTSGAFNLVLTLTGGTNVTLPTSGTIPNTAVTTLSSLTTVGVLASPHMTTATVDSGGLRVALGHIGVGAGQDPTVGVLVNATDFTGTSQFGFYSAPTFGSAATAAGYGLYVSTRTAVASFTMANLYNIRISDAVLGAGSAITTQYGLYIDSLAAATGTDYAIFTNTGLVSFGDAVTIRTGGLTISAGGMAITGSTTITGDFTSTGSLRATGVTAFASGQGAEVQFSGGIANFIGFDRTGGVYMPARVLGTSISLLLGGTATGLVVGTGGVPTITTSGQPADLILAGSATAVRQIQVGNSSAFASFGTRFSGADAYFAFNATQTSANTDSWTQSAGSVASVRAMLGGAGFTLHVAPLGTTPAINNTFWGTAVFTVSQAGVISTGTNPAAAGILRLPNNQAINARNAANSSDVGIAFVDGSNVATYGSSAASISLAVATSVTGTLTASGTITADTAANFGWNPNGTSTRYLIVNGATGTYAGQVTIQAGSGSAAFGGGITLYGHSHATKPGDVAAGISQGSGGKFRVNSSGLDGGTDWLTVSSTTVSAIGIFSGTGVHRALGSGGTLAGTAAWRFGDTNSGASRDWAIANGASATGVSQIGVLTFSISTALSGDPLAAGTEIFRMTSGGAKVTGSFQATTGFGCNGATPQTAVASGGALAAYVAGTAGLDTGAHMQAMFNLVVAMRSALVANGIMS